MKKGKATNVTFPIETVTFTIPFLVQKKSKAYHFLCSDYYTINLLILAPDYRYKNVMNVKS